MKQLTVRGFDARLARKIARLAEREGVSLNQAALRLLREGAGLAERSKPENVVGDALDHLIGTWTEDQAAVVEDAVADFERIDEAMWR